MTAPMTPPDCDLRGMPFMPLAGDRLIDSDLFLMSTGDEFKAALALWWASWKQVPAASLPDDDRLLAGLARVDLKRWTKIKPVALRGFVLCDDGRLYHSVVAEKAAEAWAARIRNRAKAAKRWDKPKGDPADAAAHAGGDAAALPLDMQGTGTVKGKKNPPTPQGGRKGPRTRIPDGFPDAEAIAEQQARCRAVGADVSVEYQADRFRGWAEANDARYVKWSATWANWIRKAIEDASKGRRLPGFSSPAPEQSTGWPERVRIWRSTGQWLLQWGAEPGDPQCQCPADLLEAG